ncbi:MAG: hypothetical protein AAF653_00865, partial [Chloroflexota bacterium]
TQLYNPLSNSRIDDIQWFPDGRHILGTETEWDDNGYVRYNIRVIDALTGEVHQIGQVAGNVSLIQLSPDGRWITIERTVGPYIETKIMYVAGGQSYQTLPDHLASYKSIWIYLP